MGGDGLVARGGDFFRGGEVGLRARVVEEGGEIGERDAVGLGDLERREVGLEEIAENSVRVDAKFRNIEMAKWRNGRRRRSVGPSPSPSRRGREGRRSARRLGL